MTIRDYFSHLTETIGEDAAWDAERAAWVACDEGDEVWAEWMAAHPEIDFEAMMDADTSVLTAWAWDMCGD